MDHPKDEEGAKPLDLALDQLVRLRDQLNQIDTDISDRIRKVEQFFGDLRLGIPITIPFPNTTDQLVYRKHGGVWQLMLERLPIRNQGVPTITTVPSMRRDERAEVAAALPQLIVAATTKLLECIDQHAAALRQVDQLVRLLNTVEGFPEKDVP